MAYVEATFPAEGIYAIFKETPGGGDIWDIDAPCNMPAKDPVAWLDHILVHTSLDHLEVAAAGEIVINHAAVAGVGATNIADKVQSSGSFAWKRGAATHTIVNHNLGFVPWAIIADGRNVLCGLPVQTQSGGRARFATPFLTTTQLRLSTWASVSSASLSAVSKTYRYLVLRRPPAPSGNILEEVTAEGLVSIGRGRLRSDRQVLQIGGDEPFGFFHGRNIDLSNGAVRVWRPDGTSYEPVPATLKLGLKHVTAPTYGASMGYDGDFEAPESFTVQAP